MSTSPAPESSTRPPSQRRRVSKWWLLLLVPLVPLFLIWAISTTLSGESADASVRAIESAPVPAGAERVERTVREGTFEQGPEARVAYDLPAGRTPAQACASLIEELRATGWTLERWGTAPGPNPNDAETFCAELDIPETSDAHTTVILDASHEASKPIVAVLSLSSEAPGGVVLAYTSN